jgi:hypothetical protein
LYPTKKAGFLVDMNCAHSVIRKVLISLVPATVGKLRVVCIACFIQSWIMLVRATVGMSGYSFLQWDDCWWFWPACSRMMQCIKPKDYVGVVGSVFCVQMISRSSFR